MNENHTAANVNLRNREIADSVIAEVILIAESCSAVGVENLVGGGIIAVTDADFVFHDRVVALANIADGPADCAGCGVIGRRTLADINIRIAGIINCLVGGDNGSGAAEVELNMFAHGVVNNALTRCDCNAARNGLESRCQLLFNIVGRSDCKIVLCGVGRTGFKGVFAVGTCLQSNGIDGRSGSFCLICFPNGCNAVVGSARGRIRAVKVINAVYRCRFAMLGTGYCNIGVIFHGKAVSLTDNRTVIGSKCTDICDFAAARTTERRPSFAICIRCRRSKRVAESCFTVGKNDDVFESCGACVQQLLSLVDTRLLVGAAVCICCRINSRLKSRKLGRIVKMTVIICSCGVNKSYNRNSR